MPRSVIATLGLATESGNRWMIQRLEFTVNTLFVRDLLPDPVSADETRQAK